jgi:hypothetical protein
VWIPVGIGPHSHTPAAIGAISSSVVTTKGDLIVATGSGVVTRQGVGADGSYLVADSTQADGITWAGPSNTAGKNAVLNSNFSVWQRGTSFSVANGVLTNTADRWQAFRGATNTTVSRQATNDTTNLSFIQYCARVQRNAADTSTAAINLAQSFENINSIPFAGKSVIFSFYARAGANYSAASNGLTVLVITGTGTDQNWSAFTGAAYPVNGTATLTTTWQRFTFSGTIATTATQIAPLFVYYPTGTAGANDYYEVTGVQLEVGSVATPYAPNGATYQAELAACQRYYWRFNMAGVSTFGVGSSTSVNGGRVTIPFPVVMRTSPTALEQSGTAGDYTITTAAGISACTSVPTFDTANVSVADTIFLSTGSLAVAGYVFRGRSANTNAYLGWSAEL